MTAFKGKKNHSLFTKQLLANLKANSQYSRDGKSFSRDDFISAPRRAPWHSAVAEANSSPPEAANSICWTASPTTAITELLGDFQTLQHLSVTVVPVSGQEICQLLYCCCTECAWFRAATSSPQLSRLSFRYESSYCMTLLLFPQL